MSNKESLLDFINENSPDKLQVEEDLGHGYVRLNVTEAHRRQAKNDIRSVEDALIELLRNCRDANTSNIYIASWKQDQIRNLVVIDNGQGIPDKLQRLIFEPRVTSKLNKFSNDKYGFHGRGMALYSIACNCLKAKVTYSQANKLTAIQIGADTSTLPEKANQSTWPTFDSKGQIKEGPLNIIRRSIEFNIQHPKINIFLGTPTEIMNLLKDKGDFNYRSAAAIQRAAEELGFDISFRNCQRILYNEIKQLNNLMSQVKVPKKALFSNSRDKTTILLNQSDMEEILQSIKKLVNEKAEEYFLKVSDDANITRLGNTLKIVLPLEIED